MDFTIRSETGLYSLARWEETKKNELHKELTFKKTLFTCTVYDIFRKSGIIFPISTLPMNLFCLFKKCVIFFVLCQEHFRTATNTPVEVH